MLDTCAGCTIWEISGQTEQRKWTAPVPATHHILGVKRSLGAIRIGQDLRADVLAHPHLAH